MMKRIEGIDNYLKMNWIRPEDTPYYTSIGINHFKIQGRHTVEKGDPVRTVECYMKERFDGNLMDLLDNFTDTSAFKLYIDNKKLDGYILSYFKTPNFCRNNCADCGYCMKYAQKSIDQSKSEAVFREAREFYSSFDQFNKMIEKYEI